MDGQAMKTCPDCRGAGYVQNELWARFWEEHASLLGTATHTEWDGIARHYFRTLGYCRPPSSEEIPCPRCEASGQVPSGRHCPFCGCSALRTADWIDDDGAEISAVECTNCLGAAPAVWWEQRWEEPRTPDVPAAQELAGSEGRAS